MVVRSGWRTAADAWAIASGLSFGEFKNRALPRLKKECPFITARGMGSGPAKKLWISINEAALREHYNYVTGWDLDLYLGPTECHWAGV